MLFNNPKDKNPFIKTQRNIKNHIENSNSECYKIF